MGALLELVLTLLAVSLVVAVIVPLTLCWLFVRQLRRSWRQRRVIAPRATAPRTSGERLGRPWALLVTDAAKAGERFRRVVADCNPGPLRDSLAGALGEVDAAVGEAQRLAAQGSRADRAHREVLSALSAQRRRRSRGLTPDLEASLADATRAQHESAERLAMAVRRHLTQLQVVVARLNEVTAHALEISATTTPLPQLSASVSIADRLAALRLATEEVTSVTRA